MLTFDGVTVALGTMHQKEKVIAPALARIGVSIVVPADFDTDQFGTFAGEISRTGTMKDAACAKARAAIAAPVYITVSQAKAAMALILKYRSYHSGWSLCFGAMSIRAMK